MYRNLTNSKTTIFPSTPTVLSCRKETKKRKTSIDVINRISFLNGEYYFLLNRIYILVLALDLSMAVCFQSSVKIIFVNGRTVGRDNHTEQKKILLLLGRLDPGRVTSAILFFPLSASVRHPVRIISPNHLCRLFLRAFFFFPPPHPAIRR